MDHMNKKIWFLQIAGWTLLVFAVTAVAVVETDSLLSNISNNRLVGYITAIVLFIAGSVLVVSSFIIRSKNRNKKDNFDFFAILSKYSGQITPEEFSIETGLDAGQSRKRLDEMHRSGVCKMFVTESGIIIYHFSEFDSRNADIIS